MYIVSCNVLQSVYLARATGISDQCLGAMPYALVKCNYECGIDTSRGGQNGDPPGMRTIPGVGSVDCRDPRIGKQRHKKSYTAFCNCQNEWTDQNAYDDWKNPVKDCSRSDCKTEVQRTIGRMRQTCRAMGAGPFKLLCEAAARAAEQAAGEVCDQCEKP